MPWIQYQFDVQGKPATVLFDTRFAEALPSDQLPHLAWFGVYLKQPNGKSWWQRSEEPTLEAIERDLIRLCGTIRQWLGRICPSARYARGQGVIRLFWGER